MFYTIGIDVGSSAVKTVLFSFDDDGSNEKLLHKELSKIRKRDTRDVIAGAFEKVLKVYDLSPKDISYVATTGEGEIVDFRRGHFYSMTAHSRGALFLNPDIRSLVDMGALHAKAVAIDSRSKVLDYRMTSQCASGSGQFLENISRYLGIPLDDVGKISREADDPEIVSNICAVLAETDVINMVSRGISTSNILKGIHMSMGKRMVRLLKALKAKGDVFVTGGLAKDSGLVSSMQELANEDDFDIKFVVHEDSVFAGSIGAALWGGFRHVKLRDRKEKTTGKITEEASLIL